MSKNALEDVTTATKPATDTTSSPNNDKAIVATAETTTATTSPDTTAKETNSATTADTTTTAKTASPIIPTTEQNTNPTTTTATTATTATTNTTTTDTTTTAKTTSPTGQTTSSTEDADNEQDDNNNSVELTNLDDETRDAVEMVQKTIMPRSIEKTIKTDPKAREKSYNLLHETRIPLPSALHKHNSLSSVADLQEFVENSEQDAKEDTATSIFRDLLSQSLDVKETTDEAKVAFAKKVKKEFLPIFKSKSADKEVLAGLIYDSLYKLHDNLKEQGSSFFRLVENIQTAFVGELQTEVNANVEKAAIGESSLQKLANLDNKAPDPKNEENAKIAKSAAAGLVGIGGVAAAAVVLSPLVAFLIIGAAIYLNRNTKNKDDKNKEGQGGEGQDSEGQKKDDDNKEKKSEEQSKSAVEKAGKAFEQAAKEEIRDINDHAKTAQGLLDKAKNTELTSTRDRDEKNKTPTRDNSEKNAEKGAETTGSKPNNEVNDLATPATTNPQENIYASIDEILPQSLNNNSAKEGAVYALATQESDKSKSANSEEPAYALASNPIAKEGAVHATAGKTTQNNTENIYNNVDISSGELMEGPESTKLTSQERKPNLPKFWDDNKINMKRGAAIKLHNDGKDSWVDAMKKNSKNDHSKGDDSIRGKDGGR